MTEAEWLQCSEPYQMWPVVRERERKACLLNVACCRRVWHLLADRRSRKAIEALERYADGQATRAEMDEADREANAVWGWGKKRKKANKMAACAVASATRAIIQKDRNEQDKVSDYAADAIAWMSSKVGANWADYRIDTEERAKHACLFRCIFGNPFRPASVRPEWLMWNNGTVVKIAETIYEERDVPSGHFDAGSLAILADALEDAGCNSGDLLDHCRKPGPHVRGCWVVDLLLRKETVLLAVRPRQVDKKRQRVSCRKVYNEAK